MTESYDYDDRTGTFEERVPEPVRRRLRTYTAFCAWPGSPRGQYDEEVDVRALGPAPARRIVEAVLAEGYEPGGKIRRLVHRPDGVMFL